MALENVTATTRGPIATCGHGDAQNPITIEKIAIVAAAASSGSTYSFGNIPANARISGWSYLDSDDLASTGTPTMKIGLFPVDGNITADDDAIHTGVDVYTAAGRVNLVYTRANFGKKAWELVSGQTTSPGGELEVKGTLTAATNTGGNVVIGLHYYLD